MNDFLYDLEDQKRLWGKVKVVDGDGCWEWQGACSPNGYGKTEIWRDGVRAAKTAHRAIYEMHLGRCIPKNLFICHKCDNKKCCRPDHLFLGTARENMMDCLSKGRHFQQKKTHCVKGHEYTPENTGRDKHGWRYCLTCFGPAARHAQYQARKKRSPDTLF